MQGKPDFSEGFLGRNLLLLLLGIAIVPGWAGTTGSISGTVKDAAGTPVVAAKLTATNKAMGGKISAVTDKKGHYAYLTLTPGVYDLDVEANGFKPASRKAVAVHLNGSTAIDLVLETQ